MAMSTMFPKFATKTADGTVIMEQRLLKKVSHLNLKISKCTGCGVCVDTCPKEAITLGMVGAAVRGATNEAPIKVDPSICSYCGVCTIMCPFNALALEIDGEAALPIKDQEGFPELDFVAEIDENKCERCTICSDVCVNDAIVRDIPVYEGEGGATPRQAALSAETKLVVDKAKCDACGICASLCPALKIKRTAFSAENPKSAGNVIWDSKLCNACKVCADACPNDAISVERVVKADAKLAGKVSIDKENCVTCSWCKTACPTEAVTITKFFEGELTIDADKCPGGCSTCADVCPCNAIYLPSPVGATELKKDGIEDKIAVNQDLCILCGACVNACPSEDAITLKRTAVHYKGTVTDLAKKIEAKLCVARTSKVVEATFGQVETKPVE
ncbi:MAG TPA: 4Fe-4S binding protein [Methanocorpusculum sp.]|nr:4Fe-4S binding protein [Methanocorpusculum sp.]